MTSLGARLHVTVRQKNDFEKNTNVHFRSLSANVQVRPGTLFFLNFETP
jgi:hypothetical protein